MIDFSLSDEQKNLRGLAHEGTGLARSSSARGRSA